MPLRSPVPFSAIWHLLRYFGPFCHDFRRFPPFLCLSPKRPHSFTQPMTYFSFPFPHDLYTSYLILSPHFLSYLLNRSFRIPRTIRSIRHTRRLVSLGLLKESYLLGSHQPIKPHCIHVVIALVAFQQICDSQLNSIHSLSPYLILSMFT